MPRALSVLPPASEATTLHAALHEVECTRKTVHAITCALSDGIQQLESNIQTFLQSVDEGSAEGAAVKDTAATQRHIALYASFLRSSLALLQQNAEAVASHAAEMPVETPSPSHGSAPVVPALNISSRVAAGSLTAVVPESGGGKGSGFTRMLGNLGRSLSARGRRHADSGSDGGGAQKSAR
jgi:hypothetical protein